MNIWLENTNLKSNSGPNSFARKLQKQFSTFGHSCIQAHNLEIDASSMPDVILCFIESGRPSLDTIPTVLRLDGIYFNTRFDWQSQNVNIKRTYDNVEGVVFQSEFAKKEIFKFFGPHKNSVVIQNGADIELIDNTPPLQNKILDSYENVWSCAASWRPHKRLQDNISYFLEHSGDKDCLVVAGKVGDSDYVNHDRVLFAGDLDTQTLMSLYKRSKYFIHLGWIDHCPNVVVDARASGCKVICSSSGGSREVAGPDAIVIEEVEEWDLEPIDLYSPPSLDFSRKVKNNWDLDYNMEYVAKMYENFLIKVSRGE